MSDPLVSVVVPTYNRPSRLKKAVNSIEKQTYENIEIIVVDDCSDISIENIIEKRKIKNPISIIRHNDNKGVGAARNTGIKNASGKYVSFLDDDDLWDEKKVEIQVIQFRNLSSDFGLIYTGAKFVNNNGEKIGLLKPTMSGDLLKDLLYRENFIPLPSVMVRRSLIKNNSLFFDEKTNVYEDRDWLISVSKNTKFYSISTPLIISVRDHGDNVSKNTSDKIKYFNYYIFDKWMSLAKEHNMIFVRKYKGYNIYRLGVTCFKNGDMKNSRKYFLKSVLIWPFIWKMYAYLVLSYMGEKNSKYMLNLWRKLKNYLVRSI